MTSHSFEIDRARAWLATVPGEIAATADRQWHDFSSRRLPVVTVYGAYDTGKSSLLRRLIVDAGQLVPAWLTISARHETFEVNEAQHPGCVLRDTPGFVAGAHDVRADMNSRLANQAVGLTDVAIITVTPQLATAEYPVLQDLLRRQWDTGTLWFVISRFDEAGVDPESDLDGYQALAQRKTDELRRALELEDDVPIFVVSQDFAQMAGSERNPDAELWDDFRSWDGVAALSAAVAEVGRSDLASLRSAAAQRYWHNITLTALDGLRSEHTSFAEHAAFTDEGLKLRKSWLAQLELIKRSAAVDLKGRLTDRVGEAIDAQIEGGQLRQSLTTAVDFWYTEHARSVEQLLRGVDSTVVLERERPSWKMLEDLVSEIRTEGPRDAKGHQSEEVITPTVERVTRAALTALIEYETLTTLKKPSAAKAITPGAPSQGVAVATAVVPLVLEITTIAEQFFRGRASAEERTRRRQETATQLDSIAENAVAVALAEFEPIVEAARQAIIEATAERVGLRDAIIELVADLEARIASGEALIAD